MWYYTLAGILIAVLLLLIAHTMLKERREVIAMLRHTIGVNLRILNNELVELNAVAASSTLAAAPVAATLLLEAGNEAKLISGILDSLSKSQLQDMLTATFAAMEKANEARHLLNACHPFI